MTDLLAGQMHMTIEGATTLLPHIQSRQGARAGE